MITVIVVNFNAGHHLAAAAEAVLADGEAGELIIIDNASADDSLATLAAKVGARPQLRVIRNRNNAGFAQGCNQGASFAQGDVLLFLNPDVVVEPGAIGRCAAALRTPGAGIVGPLIVNPDGTEQRGCRRDVPRLGSALFDRLGLARGGQRYGRRGFNRTGEPLPVAPAEVEAVSGAFLMISRTVFDHVGGWDPGYFLHGEDLDLCWRAHSAGYSVLFVPAARVVHFQGACSGQRPVRVEWHKHRGMSRFYRLHQARDHPPPLRWFVHAAIWAHFTLRVMRRTLSLARRRNA